MTLITAPFERVKIILQIQGQKQLAPGEKPKYSGGLDVVRQLYKQGGIRSVYRGSAMTLGRDGPGSAAYFATYEILKRNLTPKDENGKPGKLSLTAVCVAGGTAGVAMWIPVFPVDTIKSRMQSGEGNLSVSQTIKEIHGRGGIKAFFPGFGPAIARAIPANVSIGAVWLLIETLANSFALLCVGSNIFGCRASPSGNEPCLLASSHHRNITAIDTANVVMQSGVVTSFRTSPARFTSFYQSTLSHECYSSGQQKWWRR